MDETHVWESVLKFAKERQADGKPVFTTDRRVRNFITDVTATSIGRRSDDGTSNSSRVTRGDVAKLCTEMNGGPVARILVFTRALVAAALPELVHQASDRTTHRESAEVAADKRYIARLCWNTARWSRPTGDAAKSEQGDTYSAGMGFGHEEWLFNYQWILNGWKYGFLQPVNRSLAKVTSQVLDVQLYTIAPDRRRFYVGRIRQCEVLTEEMADDARREFRKRGWLRDMEAQVEQVGGNPDGLREKRAVLLFNVRFRPSDADLYDPAVLVGADEAIRKLQRYTLTQLQPKVEQQWASRTATTLLRPTGKRTRSSLAPTEIDLVHNQLQNELYAILQKKYGTKAIVMEEGFVDLKIRGLGGSRLVEIKSTSLARAAIREAIGQLLEYAFVCEQNGERVESLIVVAPGELDDRDRHYLDHLRTERGLVLKYVCFRQGMQEVDVVDL